MMIRKMILASHGKMAEGVVDSMEMVVGTVADLICFGLMPGHEPGEIAREVEDMIKQEPETQFLLLTDIRGGSVSNSLTRLACHKNVKLINGMNLALAIGLYLTDGVLRDEEIERVISEARDGLALVKNLNWDQSLEDEEIE